ncbi:MAG: MazG nucleotide pyrophosphohydrolase domain-containing protein [candidate division WOR-3 bacterium]
MEIKDFQELIREIYFGKDSSRGRAETFRWFVEEVGELAKAVRHNNKQELLEEFADVCAWLFSLASLYDIDMEEALRKYLKGCPRCGNTPCTCGE